jgi:predicted ATPase
VVLLEREVALRSLTTALRGAADRAGRLVLLSGEAGGGKTSVIRRFATLAQASARVMVGACEPLSSPRPLAPLLDVVPSMGVAVARTLARVRDGAPASELFDSVLAELASHHRDSVLVFEDLHWADEATLDLVRYLARRLGTVRALLVVTYRDDEIGRTHPLSVLLGDLAPMPGIQRIAIERLSRTAVAELAAGHDVDVDRLHQITGGNPFFITEVLAAPGAIPLSVRAAVRGRLARLSEPGVAVVEALAVLGTSARPDVVGDLVGDAQEGLRDAGERGLLTVNASVVAFRHELARMAVLDTVPSFRRVLLHRSVLTTLLKNDPDDDQLALVVEHAVHAGDDAAVLTYAPLAGQRAAALGAHREAAAHYGRAVALADVLPLPEQVALLQAACFEYYANADLAAITGCCVRLLQLRRQIGDQRAVGDSLRWLSLLRWSAGLARESLRLARESVRVLEAMRPGPELVFSYAHLVELSFYIHDVQSAQRYAELGSTLARRLKRPDLELRVRYFAVAARMLHSDDGWDELEEIREAAVAGGFLEHIFMMTVVPRARIAPRPPRRDRRVADPG